MAKRTRVTEASTNLQEPSDDTLDQVMSRGFRFLSGLGELIDVRAQLETRGYTTPVHDHGWLLVDTLAGRSSLAPPPPTADARGVKEHTRTVEAWADVNLPILEVSLLDHADQLAYLLPKRPRERANRADRVQTVSTLMIRMAKLADDPARKASRKADHAALALLAQRGIDDAACEAVRASLAAIQRGVRSDEPAARPAASASRPQKLALYRWLTEWTTITRTLVKNRTHLIRLGLAKPSRAKRPGVAKVPAGPAAPKTGTG